MKMRSHFPIVVISLICLFVGCSSDPDEKATELFVEASWLLEGIKAGTESYSIALESYRRAQKNIERIMSSYASSNIAVELISGRLRLCNLTLNEFKRLEDLLIPLAEAEQRPLPCALLVARAIEDEFDRAKALSNIASKFSEIGEKDEAVQLLSEALETIDASPVKFGKAEILADIADKYAAVGQKDKAAQLLSQAIESPPKYYFLGFAEDVALADIVGIYAGAGQFAKALKTVKNIQYVPCIVAGLVYIANSYTVAAQKDSANQLLHQALQHVSKIEDTAQKANAFAHIASGWAKAGQNDKAEQLLPQALAGVIKMENAAHKGSTLKSIAGTYALIGLFPEALKTAKAIEGQTYKDGALKDIAGAYADAGQFTQALETAAAIDSPFHKAKALANIACVCAGVGQKDEAARLSSQALGAAKTIENKADKTNALVDIAGIYVKSGQKLSQGDAAILRSIVQATTSTENLW